MILIAKKSDGDTRFIIAVLLGMLSSIFFSITFIINKGLSNAGDCWQWSSAIRYLVTLPILMAMHGITKNNGYLRKSLRNNIVKWAIGGTVGFGLFYAPLTFAAYYGPAWLVSGVWQITILAGIIIDAVGSWSKLNGSMRMKIPWMAFLISVIIIIGVGLTMCTHLKNDSFINNIYVIIPIIVAGFSYPLGNRIILNGIEPHINIIDRMLGMNLGSLPFWLFIAGWGFIDCGWPSIQQICQVAIVAVSSGIVATWLFYRATHLVYRSPTQLAAVEATQAGEVLFSVVGSVIWLGESIPNIWSLAGLGVIIMGMFMHALQIKKS